MLGIPFGTPEIIEKLAKFGSVSVRVKIDVNSLREVTAWVGGEPYRLKNQCYSLAHHSVRTILAAYKAIRDGNPKDNLIREHILAKHAQRFSDQIETAIERHGLPSTTISAKQLDQFEDSYIFKTRITKSPAASVSADMNTFLSGGSGPGIYSAADCAAERSTKLAEATAETSDNFGSDEQASDIGADVTSDTTGPGAKARQPAKKREPTIFSGTPKGKGYFT